MKTVGIIFIVFGALNLIVFICAAIYGSAQAAATHISGSIMLFVLGGLFIHIGNKRKKEKKEKEEWNNK
jgi:membrane associated rhomboid family serine protease